MKIKIKHLARIEGHAGFSGLLLRGQIKKAKIEIQEGARLIEGLLIGRHFSEAPIITARVCGICPVIHNLTAIQAIENAFKIKARPKIVLLRKLMLAAQIIHSHTLHLFFLSLPDFLNFSDDLTVIKKYPHQARAALEIRNFGNKIIEVIGGRAIHPITSEVGGFKKYPTKAELKKLYQQSSEILPQALDLAKFFKNLKYPDFRRPTNFASLHNPKEYAFYDGKMKWQAANGQRRIVNDNTFFQKIQEIEAVGEVVKRAKYNQQIYMVGALARINNNAPQLNKAAKKTAGSLIKERPIDNTFYNIFAQAVEVIHFIEECQKLLKTLITTADKRGWDADKRGYLSAEVLTKADISGNPRSNQRESALLRGLAACEAPRGTLFHYYEIDNQGLIKKCNIITPTAQFLNNIEEDLKVWLWQVKNLSKKERERKIKTLIRAYDPCISCATH